MLASVEAALYPVVVNINTYLANYGLVFLLVSIFLNVTEPFFLFFNRNKDMGMPPRRQEYTQEPQEPVYEQSAREFWETDDTDNL